MVDLVTFVKPDETALQLYARNYVEPVQTGIQFCPAVIPGQLLELAGRSGSGKTTFLLHAALNAILPSQIGGQSIGGLEVAKVYAFAENVLFIDLDQKVDILRLMEMLHAKLQPILSTQGRDDEALDRLIHECLQRFNLITCTSSFELLATLKTIQPFVINLQGQGGIHLLLVDNISAFYWMDYPVKAVPREQGQTPSDLTLQAVHTAVASMLKTLSKQLKLAVLVTKHCFKSLSYGENDEVDYWDLKEMMCKPWMDALSQRILLRRANEHISSEGCSFLAKWDKPKANQVFEFSIAEAGILNL